MKKLAKTLVATLFCLVLLVTSAGMTLAANNMANVSLKAKATYNSVTLTWEKVSGASGYEVQQYKSGKWTDLKDKGDKFTSTSYKISSLKIDTTYKFRIRAWKKKTLTTDYSKKWTEVSVKTSLGKVADLEAKNTSSTSVKLTWDKVSGATGYQVYRSTDGKKWSKITTTSKDNYENKKLTYGKTYQYKVRAYRKSGSKTYYGSYSSVEKIKADIPKPGSFKVSKSAYNYVTLSWSKVSGAKDYQIYKSTDGKKWKELKVTKETSYKDTKVDTGTKYYYKVRARQTISKKTKTSAYTSVVNVTPALGKPGDFNAKASAASVDLTWDKVSGATGYRIYVRTNTKDDWERITTIKSASTEKYTAKNLVPGTKYYFRIKAYRVVNGKDVSSSYVNDDVTTKTLGKLSGVTVDSVTSTSAELSWDAVKYASGYEVMYSSDGGAYWFKTTTKGNSATLESLNNDKAYLVKVRAYVTSNKVDYYGSYSEISTLKIIPGLVKDFYLEAGEDSVKATWTDSAAADGYEIEYRIEGGQWTKKEKTDFTFNLSGLEESSIYEFRIRQYAEIGGEKKYGDYVYSKATIGKLEAIYDNGAYALNWSPVEYAAKYEIQNYLYFNGNWSKRTTVESTSYRITPSTYASEVIRVVACDENGNIISGFEPIVLTRNDCTVKLSGNTVDLTWPAKTGANYYAICKQMPNNKYTLYGYTTTNSLKGFALAPNEVSTIMIFAFKEKPTNVVDSILYNTVGSVGSEYFTVVSSEPELTNSASQLQYLVSAINKTKQTGNVTVHKYNSFETNMKHMKMGDLMEIDFEKEKIWFMGLPVSWDSEIGKSVQEMVESEELKEVTDLTYTFPESGVYTYTETDKNGDEKTKQVRLSSFVEPTNSTYAYLYNAVNSSSWKSGFDSVTSTKQSDGTIKIVAKLKQEKFGSEHSNSTALYHPGFASTVSDVAVDNTLNHKDSSVGATTITAVINESGLLVSYDVSSKYVMEMAGEIDGTETEMSTYGDIVSKYTFTR